MIIEPRTRGFICLTAHPDGCAAHVKQQIDYVKGQGKLEGPKRVLVIGASTGFGLASRISAAFGFDASTIGVYFEKPPAPKKTASPGWYNTAAFETAAHEAGLYAKSINGDAFSDAIKDQTIALIKEDLGQVDLIIYSLASPRRTDPKTGETFQSTLKPIGQVFEDKTVDFHTGEVKMISIEPASGDDISNTVKVMGGEDWELWIDAMKEAGVLAENAKTVAYSYIGYKVTEAVYSNGTIGQAKSHLESTVALIDEKLKDLHGKAYVSVNKGLVTQASSAIPVIPLYISLLYKTMKEKGIHEGCIEQIYRLYNEHLFTENGEVPVDEKGRIRIDDWELREDVQEVVAELWKNVTTESLKEVGDLEGYRTDFFNLFGFEIPGVDYAAEADEMVQIPGLQA